tara:strand:+ start:1266 stop:1583 length:318 start_codon:yes stop_codon:yes gene_type:complete
MDARLFGSFLFLRSAGVSCLAKKLLILRTVAKGIFFPDDRSRPRAIPITVPPLRDFGTSRLVLNAIRAALLTEVGGIGINLNILTGKEFDLFFCLPLFFASDLPD